MGEEGSMKHGCLTGSDRSILLSFVCCIGRLDIWNIGIVMVEGSFFVWTLIF